MPVKRSGYAAKRRRTRQYITEALLPASDVLCIIKMFPTWVKGLCRQALPNVGPSPLVNAAGEGGVEGLMWKLIIRMKAFPQ